MDLQKYPNYANWLQFLDNRNVGILSVFAVAVVILGVFVECRWLWPRFMPALRNVALAVYVLLLIVSILVSMIGVVFK